MTLQQMKYVLAIAEEGSMNKAAEQLFISQPSLTSSMRELEGDRHSGVCTQQPRRYRHPRGR